MIRIVHVIVLGKEGCNPCARVKRLLLEMRSTHPELEVEEVDMASPRGLELALRHNVLYPPAVFIDGVFLAFGKIREADLDRALSPYRKEAA